MRLGDPACAAFYVVNPPHRTGLVWDNNLCLGSHAFLKGESEIDVADPADHGMVVTAVGSMGLSLLLMPLMRVASHSSYRLSTIICGSTVVDGTWGETG